MQRALERSITTTIRLSWFTASWAGASKMRRIAADPIGDSILLSTYSPRAMRSTTRLLVHSLEHGTAPVNSGHICTAAPSTMAKSTVRNATIRDMAAPTLREPLPTSVRLKPIKRLNCLDTPSEARRSNSLWSCSPMALQKSGKERMRRI